MSYHIWMIEKWLKFKSEFQRSGLRYAMRKMYTRKLRQFAKILLGICEKRIIFPKGLSSM